MSMVKTDIPPSTRLRASSAREAWPAAIVGSGAMVFPISWGRLERNREQRIEAPAVADHHALLVLHLGQRDAVGIAAAGEEQGGAVLHDADDHEVGRRARELLVEALDQHRRDDMAVALRLVDVG